MRLMIKKHKGSVLITALAVMAITAGIATSLLMRQSIEIKKTELMLIQDKLFSYAQGVEAWGVGELLKAVNGRPKDQQADDLTQDWAKPYETVKIDGVTISGRIIDLQGFFNINTLLFEDDNEPELGVNPGEKEEKADKEGESAGGQSTSGKEKKIPENYLPSQVLKRVLERLPGYSSSGAQAPEITVKYIKDWISSQDKPSDQDYEQGTNGYAYSPGSDH